MLCVVAEQATLDAKQKAASQAQNPARQAQNPARPAQNPAGPAQNLARPAQNPAGPVAQNLYRTLQGVNREQERRAVTTPEVNHFRAVYGLQAPDRGSGHRAAEQPRAQQNQPPYQPGRQRNPFLVDNRRPQQPQGHYWTDYNGREYYNNSSAWHF